MSNLVRSMRRSGESPATLGFGEWLEYFNFDGNSYPLLQSQTLTQKKESIGPTFAGYARGAYESSGTVFACMMIRQLLFSEARFQFRQMVKGRPGELFGTQALKILEAPWPNGTTGDLLSRAIQDVDLAGNSFTALKSGALRRLRPDWMSIILGSKTGQEFDAEPVGYLYEPPEGKPLTFLPEEIAHFAPIPDPLARFRGMSWITPIIREVLGDRATTTHKLKFFENGATPSLVVKFDPEVKKDMYDHWVERFDSRHNGLSGAYKTLYLGGGADATVVGANMQQIDFKDVQAAGETRIAAAAGVPPVLAGFAEGIKAATYSNYQQATRRFADGTMRPLWRNLVGSFASIVKAPAGAELWYDDRDISFLQEDAKDAAEIQGLNSKTISNLIMAGFEPDSVIEAVAAGDLSRLTHTGTISVQMWDPTDNKSPGTP